MAAASKTNNTVNVSTGKPKALGAVFWAPLGTTLPTDAKTALHEDFACLGYVSEDGLTNAVETDSESIKEWGGDTVLTVMSSREETFSLTFIEANPEVLKLVYGEGNVTGDIETGTLKVVHNAKESRRSVFVFEIVLSNNRIKRIVAPAAQLTEVGEISYVPSEAVGYEATITAFPDENGNTAYEYFAKAV